MSDVTNNVVMFDVRRKLARVIGERERIEGILATRCALLERIAFDLRWPAGNSNVSRSADEDIDVTGATLPDVATLLAEVELLKKLEAYLSYSAVGLSRTGRIGAHDPLPDLQALSAELTHAQAQAATIDDARRHGDEWRQHSAGIVAL